MSVKGEGGRETASSEVITGSGVAPATGKLGVMVVGLGAVATTMIAPAMFGRTWRPSRRSAPAPLKADARMNVRPITASVCP